MCGKLLLRVGACALLLSCTTEVTHRPKLELQFTDASGRPLADLPVRLCTHTGLPLGGSCEDSLQGETDRNGRLVVAHYRTIVRLLPTATPAIGFSLVGACLPGRRALGALIGGGDGSATLALRAAALDDHIVSLGRGATALPGMEAAAAALHAQCGWGGPR